MISREITIQSTSVCDTESPSALAVNKKGFALVNVRSNRLPGTQTGLAL